MHILYPDDPLEPHTPEPLYREEFAAARAAGLSVSIFSFEDFEHGRFRARPALPAREHVLYRGWMLTAARYARLVEQFREHAAEAVTSADEYCNAHHLPRWYPVIEEFTANTLIFSEDTDFVTALAEHRWPGYFVKDFVKSLSTRKGSLVANTSEIADVIAQLKKYRGEIEGGVCVRRREDYVANSERRYFVVQGAAYASDGEVPAIVAECARRVASPFFSIDVARRSDGELRVIEIGDGQVSDRKEWKAAQLIPLLQRLGEQLPLHSIGR